MNYSGIISKQSCTMLDSFNIFSFEVPDAVALVDVVFGIGSV